MNATEQRNYIIAAIVSLIFHFSILTIFLRDIPATKNPGLETFPVGIVEMSPGSPKGAMVSQSAPKSNITVPLHSPKNRQPRKGQTISKSKTKPNQLSKGATALPKKDGITVSGNPLEKPGNQNPPGGNIETKSNMNPDQLSKDATVPTKKEGMAVSGNPGEKPISQSQRVLGGNAEEMTGSGNSESGGPRDLGTGEEMVTALGSMPTYPANVMKERKEGRVAVRLMVNAGGSLELAIVTKSSGDLRLDYAATSSIKRNWKFKPITKGYYIDVVFSFSTQIGVSVKFLNSKTRY